MPPSIDPPHPSDPTAGFTGPHRRYGDGGILASVIYGTAIVVAVAHLWFNTLASLPGLWVGALHFAGFGLLCALTVPGIRRGDPRLMRLVLWGDVVLGLAAVGCAVYLILSLDALYDRGVRFIWSDWIAAIVAVAVVLELVRRTTGWLIPMIIVLAVTYVFWWGRYIEGVFHFPGLSLETVLFRAYFGEESMFGPMARISWSYVFMFMMFGTFLMKSGAGDFIIDLSRATAGRLRGGPGLVAVMSSGLMGSVSGSAIANTASTGVITIPLMRRAGFAPRFAAGIEAAASTGGQLMPPVMGAGAFIMANYTQVSYLTIIGYATLPALLYFLSVAFYVRIEAVRTNIAPVAIETPPLHRILRDGWPFLLPMAVLIGMLVQGYTPTYAGGVAIGAVVAASWLSSRPMGPRAVLDALAEGAVQIANIAVLLVAIGILVTMIATTGIGNTFSLMVAGWSGGSLFLTLLLVALASLILGMGLPVTAAYIVLATLSAPALYGLITDTHLMALMTSGTLPEAARTIFLLVDPARAALLAAPMPAAEAAALLAAVPPDFKEPLLTQSLDPALLTAALISAHMIIFWLSQDSNVTPPVCLAAFAAAAIADTPPMRTGLSAWKLAKGLYIMPLLFAYTPLIGGTAAEMAWTFGTAMVGIYALIGAIEGHLEAPVAGWGRLLLVLAAGLLMWPHGEPSAAVAGMGLVAALLIGGRQRAHPIATEPSDGFRP